MMPGADVADTVRGEAFASSLGARRSGNTKGVVHGERACITTGCVIAVLRRM